MRRRTTRRGFLVGVGAVCAGSASARAVAAADSEGGPADAVPGADAMSATPATVSAPAAATIQNADEVADTVRDLVETSLEEHDVPGATVAVVADGEVALAEGFGVTDRETGTAAEAGTPFRIGSVSKAVTWTALMRPIQRGDLEPDADVAETLDVPVPDSKGTVTPAALATHRAGLEDGNSQLWVRNAGDLGSLPSHLRRATISQVRPPGEVGSYSNYGAALGGQVLAATREEPFETAIENELLGPLGMESSSFSQPLPDGLAGAHATGHAAGSRYRNGNFPYVGLRPAGAMSTTATDMARFLQAHVNDGVVDGERVLADETVDALHRQWATHHESLAGMAFGLVENDHGETRVLRHNGATLSFVSDVVLVPEAGLGLFVAYNDSSAGSAMEDVVDGFLDEHLGGGSSGSGTESGTGSGTDAASESGSDPSDTTTPLTPDGRPARTDALEGTYRSVRLSKTGHDRITSTLQAPTVSVSVGEDGALRTTRGSTTQRWVEVEPLVFEHVTENRRLAFRTAGEGTDGTVEYLFLGGSVSAYAPVGAVDNLSLHAVLTGVTVLGMLSMVLGSPAAALVRWYRGSDDATLLPDRARLRTEPAAQARWVASGAVLAFAAFVVLALVHFGLAPLAVLSTPPLTFTALFALAILGVLGALAAVAYTGHALYAGSWSRPGRVHYAVVTASLVGFAWLLGYWNLVFPP
jgi:CubicO group peptidase (beta-lactamase class C family)